MGTRVGDGAPLKVVGGQKNIFFKLFFFIPGPLQGGHFLGEIISFSALGLKPASLNLRPAQYQARIFYKKCEARMMYIKTCGSAFNFVPVGCGEVPK